jgi:glycosyltransferase involved in cell wall biosynthesis
VSTAVGNAADLLDEGRAGVLIAPGDEVGLVAALESLKEDVRARDNFARAARARAVARFSQQRMLDHYEALYRGETID